jgi:hypothetical protein
VFFWNAAAGGLEGKKVRECRDTEGVIECFK